MTEIPPEHTFIKPHSTQHSNVDVLSYIGNYYSEQIFTVCGSRTLGGVLEYLSRRDLKSLLLEIHRCCKNLRCGEECITKQKKVHTIPLINKRAAKTLMKLVLLGRSQPNLFGQYRVKIIVPSNELQCAMQNL